MGEHWITELGGSPVSPAIKVVYSSVDPDVTVPPVVPPVEPPLSGGTIDSYLPTGFLPRVDLQQASGAWPCTAGPGEAFGTAVATLILQIPYQYLPIFQR